ncbi:DUF4124 domain-containing protein [Hydrogenophaga sp. A37]|uniref:DUF4124 domain-containing protein n=1 Tax=Hydrogenophaga sp. A37 TaxID=1945864 RepID=UPI0015584ECF|nr:DUF4124 domain-containing protein [Hydrogenophaga sp. A37]
MKNVFRRWAWAGLLLCNSLIHAQVYTWTDAQGRKHFGDEVSTPENKRGTPVKIPLPNIAKRFEPNTPPASNAPADGSAPVPTPASAPKAETKKLPGLAAQQEACKAQKQAYQASEACYAECSTPVQNKWGGGRNNAKCGHCSPMTTPRC